MSNEIRDLRFEVEVLAELVRFIAAELSETQRQNIRTKQKTKIVPENQYNEAIKSMSETGFAALSDDRAIRIKYVLP